MFVVSIVVVDHRHVTNHGGNRSISSTCSKEKEERIKIKQDLVTEGRKEREKSLQD